MKQGFCVSLIGMPGSGKSTIGQLLASLLGFAFVDSDYIIEALYARRLQEITELLPRDQFLDVEAQAIATLRGVDCVIATGGSAIYRAPSMEHLRSLGPVIYLQTSLSNIERRIALNPQRGISFGPGQTLPDLFGERQPLYEQYAEATCATDALSPSQCAQYIAHQLDALRCRAHG